MEPITTPFIHLNNTLTKPKAGQKVVYISGKVTGLPIKSVDHKFREKEIKLLADGHYVINPVSRFLALKLCLEPLPHNWNERIEWILAMRLSIKDLMTADEIHLLHDWQDSKGALEEVRLAKLLRIPIVYP